MRIRTLLPLVALVLASCADQQPDLDSLSDDLASSEVPDDSADGKDDSLRHQTYKGALRILTPETDSLVVGRSGFHRYTLTGRSHWQVNLVHKSGAFRTYLRVTAPSGRRWNVAGVRDPNNGAWYSVLDLTMPETGTYQVLATSYRNMYYGASQSRGEYTLSADADLFCGGIAAFPCPDYLECLLDGDYPDAGGTCAQPGSCRSAADCDGPHILCVGGWTCDAESGGIGTCSYQCGPVGGGVGAGCGSRGMAPCEAGLFCNFPLSAQCGAADHPGSCQELPQACIEIYSPVCGCDGQTYSNSCVANAAGVSVSRTGECAPAALTWYQGCGYPICRIDDVAPAGTPRCGAGETVGASCAVDGARCDAGLSCGATLVCASSDPQAAGCPRSQRDFKTDISYVTDQGLADLYRELMDLRLTTYRYSDPANGAGQKLGFIIDETRSSAPITADRQRVDLYGYTSMTVAALKVQAREIEALRQQLAAMTAGLGGGSPAMCGAPR